MKAFFGTTLNAVQAQLWIAVIAYVLVVRFKHRHQLPQELNEILQILSVTIMEKVPVNELFLQEHQQHDNITNRNQLHLFEL